MRVLAVADRVDLPIFEIRLGLPLQTLVAERGWTLHCAALLDVTPGMLAQADVLVLQRGVTARALSLMRAMRRSGGHVVYEIDDLLTEPAPHLGGVERLLRQVATVKACLAAADVASVSTARLAMALQPLAPRVHLVPNHACPRPPQAVTAREGTALTLFFAASDHVAAEPLMPALRRLLDEAPDRLRLVAVGPAAQPLQAAGLPVLAQGLMARQEFLAFAAALPGAVAVIPLGRTPFEACKSAVKYFDYAACGIATVCSAVPPYADVVSDGVTGRLVADTPGDWERALRELLHAPELAQRWARAAQADVARRFTLAHTVQAWATLLDRLGPRRHAPPPPPWWQGGLQALRAVQHWNRARLARRQARGG